MASVLLGQVVPSDGALIKLLENIDKCSKLPRWTSTPFDIIVLDEFQDCNPETFWLVECFVRANNLRKGGQPARIVVLGDERQSIYRFRGADPRYLTLAPEVLGPISSYPFTEVQLGNIFRLSSSTVQFTNRVFLGGEQFISSSKRGPKPIVLRCNIWDSLALARAIFPLVNRYKPENCVIIAPSIRTRGPLQELIIVERHLHVHRLAPPLPRHEHIHIRNVVPSDLKRGFYESVSDINGLVIAAALELETAGTLRSLGRPSKGEVDETLPKCPEKLVAWLCRKTCEYEASLSGYLPRVIQMKDHKYDWIKPEDLSLAQRRLDSELVGSARKLDFEVEMQQRFYIDGQETQLCGRADIVHNSATESNDDMDNRTIWEIKFVSSLSNEHVIQACVYAYLSGSESGKSPRIILYNVRDGDGS